MLRRAWCQRQTHGCVMELKRSGGKEQAFDAISCDCSIVRLFGGGMIGGHDLCFVFF